MGDKPARKPRSNLTAAQQVERNANLCRERARGKSWAYLAEKYSVSESTAKRAWAEFRDNRKPKLAGRDPFDIVWESVERYEEWIEWASEAADEADNSSARVGAINTIARLQAMRDDLLQKSGILPQNLGKLKVEHDVRFIAAQFVQILAEDNVPIETRKKLLAALGRGSDVVDQN
jgi:hypothetical protein